MNDLVWQHVIIGSKCSWLHGDERGFRNRHHRIHSSGDYKTPPPKQEHAGLRRYHASRSGKPVNFKLELRISIAREFVNKMHHLGFRLIACSIGNRHLHALTELPSAYDQMKQIVGKCKQRASHAVRDILPGGIWAAGGEFKRVKDREHLHNVFEYIRTKQEAGAIVWSHRKVENWIDDPTVGVVIVARKKKQIRVFGMSQTPVSEVLRRPGSERY
jgi:hypothetical protein